MTTIDNKDNDRNESQNRSVSTTEHYGPTRRTVLKAGAVGAGALGLVGLFHDGFGDRYAEATPHGTGDDTDSYTARNVIYSMCMQCNTYCTIKVRLTDPGESGATSLVRKIAGNPYSPLMTQPLPAIPYDTDPEAAVVGLGNMPKDSKSRSGGVACLKGQAGAQIVHDRMRITQPLKRVGERGSKEWKTISWDQAVEEIVNGSDLGTPGLKEWWAFAPEEPVMTDWAKVGEGEMTQAEFEDRWGDKLIDPTRPEIGPKSNLMAVLCGERQPLLGERFANNVFGTKNQFNHGGTCGLTGVQANVHTHPTTNYKRMYVDIDATEYLIVWGTEPLTAQKGPTWLAPRISNARQRGMKMVVVDPRMSKTAEKADVWMPVKPGKDIDLAFAMIRWILDNKTYDETYLRLANAKAAEAAGEPTWCDATHLVDVTDETRPKINAWALGLADTPEDPKTADPAPVVLVNGELTAVADVTGPADLDVDTEVDGKRLRSVFNLLLERVNEKTFEEYAEASGIPASTIEQVSREFTSHGKRAGVMSYRGPAMHTNGYDAVRAIGYLNFLIGNHDWKGGHIGAQKGFSPQSGRYDLGAVPDANAAWGYPITREKVKYESTPFFKEEGYPARRRWVPFTGNACHEVIPSAGIGYPYSLKALFMSRHSPLNSSPGGRRNAEYLKMTDKIELVVSIDTTLGDSTLYADYVFPDLTYLEKFCQESIYPSQQYAVTQIGQPTTRAFEGPRAVEELYIDIAKKMELPGVGEGAFGEGTSFDRSEDYWLKMVANIAYAGENPVADASPEEEQLFVEARELALGDSFDLTAWKAAVTPEEWPKVVTVLNRGGRFAGQAEDRSDGYDGEWLKHRYEGLCQFYDNKTANLKDSMTGEYFDGLPVIRPVTKSDGTVIEQTNEFPLQFVNWKSRSQGTYRTVNSPWLREINASNYLWVNTKDAQARGIENGDSVSIESSAGKVVGTAYVTEGIRPGIVGADSAYGHRGYGAEDVIIDGEVRGAVGAYGHSASAQRDIPGKNELGFAPSRKGGFPVNDLLEDDTVEGGIGLVDPIGGAAAQLDTWVQVAKA